MAEARFPVANCHELIPMPNKLDTTKEYLTDVTPMASAHKYAEITAFAIQLRMSRFNETQVGVVVLIKALAPPDAHFATP
jgi:hypothetical protein